MTMSYTPGWIFVSQEQESRSRATNQKTRDFIREPLKDARGVYKNVDTVGGIGDKAADALHRRGFVKAFHLVGQYLVLNMNEELFKQWLKDLLDEEGTRIQDRYIDDAYISISEWCEVNM